jgi:hypothetical protein
MAGEGQGVCVSAPAADFFEAVCSCCEVSPKLVAKWVINVIMPDVKRGVLKWVYINGVPCLAPGPNLHRKEFV